MWLIVAVPIVVVALALWAYLARRPRGTPLPEVNPDGSGRFHAVSIRFGPGACTIARDLHGTRYLSAQAPRLPLPGCDAADCQCRFVHHRDRRAGDDRRKPFQGGYGGSATRIDKDRRDSPDRRRGSREIKT